MRMDLSREEEIKNLPSESLGLVSMNAFQKEFIERIGCRVQTIKLKALNNNQKKIGSIQHILIEKESKKSSDFWSGRTDGNIWTIVKKNSELVKDVVPVKITDAKGVTLFGENINN